MQDRTSLLTQFFNTPIDSLAEIFHYNEENRLILSGDEKTFYAKYPKTVAFLNGSGAMFRMDKRTPFEFCYNLVMNWLLEDYVAFRLSNIGFETKYGAHDRNRSIVSRRVTTDPDILIKVDGAWVPIEVQADYSGWVSNGGALSIKEGKYRTLMSQKAMLMQICVATKSFCLIPSSQLTSPSRIWNNEKMGGKRMVAFDNLNLTFSPFDNREIKGGTHTYIPNENTAARVTERLTPLPQKYRKREVVEVSTKYIKPDLWRISDAYCRTDCTK